MPIGAQTILSALILGDDLHLAEVQRSPAGVRARSLTVLRAFLSMSSDDARRALAAAGMSAATAGAPAPRLVLILPASWCALRPIALDVRSWPAARDEVLRSISGLFPLEPADAMLGLIERDADAGAYLVAASRARVEQWTAALQRAIGAGAVEVLPPHIAIMGLGLQHSAVALVLERSETGDTLAHTLRFGRPVSLAEPRDGGDDAAPRPAAADALFLPDGAPDTPMLSTIAPADLAVAAAIVRELARAGAAGAYAPLAGKPVHERSPWLAPAAACAAAVALLLGGLWLRDARFEAGIARLEGERQAIADQVRDLRRDRDDAERLARLVDRGFNAWASRATPIAPALAAAQNAVPTDGFLYRVDVDPRSATIKGEAPRSLDVLARLEATEEFSNAASLDPPAAVPERTLETFSIRALRATSLKPEVRP